MWVQMRDWRSQNESLNGYKHRGPTDQNAKNSQNQSCSIGRADLTALLIPVLHAIRVCMQYLIHMQEGLWSLQIRRETREFKLIDTE